VDALGVQLDFPAGGSADQSEKLKLPSDTVAAPPSFRFSFFGWVKELDQPSCETEGFGRAATGG
jgi:hypothetical protein